MKQYSICHNLKELKVKEFQNLFFFISGPQGVPAYKSDINDCASQPCLNGGTCFNLYRRYACRCPFGYTGTECQTPGLFLSC